LVQFPLNPYSPLTQDWGWNGSSYHMGEDILADEWTSVFAAASGWVKYSGSASGYGNVIIIEHSASETGCGQSTCTLYGHLKPTGLATGYVTKGDPIGIIGNTSENGGWTPHLHFAVFWGPYTSPWIYYGYDPPGDINDTTDPTDFVIEY